MNKKSERFRKAKSPPSHMKRLEKRKEERDAMCPHGHPLLRCRPCRKELELKKHPNTVFI